jgi:hypothetical protein
MIRGWYHNIESEQRFLSIEEAATACSITTQNVRDSLIGKSSLTALTGKNTVDAAEVISFLIRNGMPVSPSLLPNKTRNILFIAADDFEFQDQGEIFDHICRYFADKYNILVETSILGKSASNAILSFSPDVVVFFLKELNPATINTLYVHSNNRELKVILIINDSVNNTMGTKLDFLHTHLTVNNTLPIEKLTSRLRSAFDN